MSLEHWQTEDAFTLHEAACLIVGLDPLAKLPAQHENEGKLALLCRQLDRDYRHEASQLIDAVLRHFHPDSEEDPELHSPNSISWITKMHDGIRSKNYLISYLPQTGALHILYICSVTRQAACRLGCQHGDESCSVSTGPVFG